MKLTPYLLAALMALSTLALHGQAAKPAAPAAPGAKPEKGSTAEKKVNDLRIVPDAKLPNVLLIGDSISIGYHAGVSELLKGKANVFRPVNPKNGTADTRQNRFQVGFAYRPVDNNKFDALGLYEQKLDKSVDRDSNTDIISLRANYHPSRPWWLTGRFAYKRVNELLAGTVNDSYSAALIGGRVTYDITNRWSIGGITTVLVGTRGGKQYAYGLEAGYTVMDNLIVGIGYNWRGFSGGDLNGSDYTNRGWVLNVRYKFDEDLFKGSDASVNRTLNPQGAPAVGSGAAPANALPPTPR